MICDKGSLGESECAAVEESVSQLVQFVRSLVRIEFVFVLADVVLGCGEGAAESAS